MADARTSLGFIEDKLRRALNLAGDIRTKFSADLVPIVIADDSTRPGCNSLRGRRFSAGFDVGAVAVDQLCGFKVTQACIISRLVMGAVAGASYQVDAIEQTPDQADPAAAVFNATQVPWTERRAVATDWAPVSIANNFAIGASVFTTVWQVHGLTTAQEYELIREPIHLEAGTRIWLRARSALTQWWYRFDGQVF